MGGIVRYAGAQPHALHGERHADSSDSAQRRGNLPKTSAGRIGRFQALRQAEHGIIDDDPGQKGVARPQDIAAAQLEEDPFPAFRPADPCSFPSKNAPEDFQNRA